LVEGIRHSIESAVALLALAACKGSPARLVAGLADTVVVNNVVPMQMPMHVFDAAGHPLPDTGIRFERVSGAAIPVSNRGVMKCTQAGDVTLRASLGPLVTSFLVRCRPVADILGARSLNLLVGDSSYVLTFAPVDSAGRRVTLFTMGIDFDSAVVRLDGWRLHARAPGQTNINMYIGDSWTSWFVRVYERASTVEGIRPGQGLAIPVHVAGGEMLSVQLPPSPPNISVTMLPDGDSLRVPRLAMLGANCQDGLTTSRRAYYCFALRNASAVAYHPKANNPTAQWTGMIAVWRDPCPGYAAKAPCPE
jgi:hypothetical protein